MVVWLDETFTNEVEKLQRDPELGLTTSDFEVRYVELEEVDIVAGMWQASVCTCRFPVTIDN
jgi:hypothetical protein